MNGRHTPPKDKAAWDKRYTDGEAPWDTGEPDSHLQELVEGYGIEPGPALDIGCGTGTNAIWLAQRGFQVTGTDLAPTAVEMANAKIQAESVSCQFICADFMKEPVPGGPFHFVYDRGCFHVFDKDESRRLFAEGVAGLLSPDGLWHSLVGSTDGPDRDTGPPRRSAEQITVALEPLFEILELRSASFDDDRHAEIRAWVVVSRKRRQS